ncbi:MAG TPA: DUF5777 family beta-barrel protein, partial [Longimicrobiales bacterium]|nr:DUF5777 family beta-barrel protein [Longimicrobiales bacterium]
MSHFAPNRANLLVAAAALTAALAPRCGLAAQDSPRWERSEAPVAVAPTVFHATQSLNLPTAVTPGSGEFLFEISHRFVPAISSDGTLFGLDGPVRYRLGLGYGITDALTVGVTRSNLDDNTELGAKLRVLATGGAVPFQVAVAGGVAWNKEVGGLQGSSTQVHAELVLNAGLGRRVALGVIPALVANPLVRVDGEDAAFSVGFHGQVYLSEQVSLVGEWVATEERPTLPNDPASLSVELETGGHF